jgi:hypothetical protein
LESLYDHCEVGEVKRIDIIPVFGSRVDRSSAGSGKEFFSAGGAKAPGSESTLDNEMQSEVTPHGGRAEPSTVDSSDSDCQVTGTSRFETLEGEATGPARGEVFFAAPG